MIYLIAIFCLSALTSHLMAEQSNTGVVSVNEKQRNYTGAETFLRKLYPDADIQIGTNGSIRLHVTATDRTFDPHYNRQALEPLSDRQNVFLLEPSGTMTLEWSFSLRKDPTYAQNLPIRHFILTESQMTQFFSNPSFYIDSLDFSIPSESKLYLVVQIKNKGPRFASGTLYFPFFQNSLFISVDLEPNMKEFSTYVVPLGSTSMEDFKDAKSVNDRLDNLLWDKLSVGLTEEEIINSLQEWAAGIETDEYKDDDDPEEGESRFPIFRSTE